MTPYNKIELKYFRFESNNFYPCQGILSKFFPRTKSGNNFTTRLRGTTQNTNFLTSSLNGRANIDIKSSVLPPKGFRITSDQSAGGRQGPRRSSGAGGPIWAGACPRCAAPACRPWPARPRPFSSPSYLV